MRWLGGGGGGGAVGMGFGTEVSNGKLIMCEIIGYNSV